MRAALRILMPSIVDADVRRGGAWTVTRGLVELLRRDPWQADLVSLVAPEPRWRRLRQAACLAAAQWGGMPAKVRFVRSGAFREQIRRSLEREHFDLLVINGSDLLWCLEHAPPQVRTLAIVHNREAELFADQVATSVPRFSLLRRPLRAEFERLRQFEIDGLRRAGAAMFVSSADAAAFGERIPELERLVLPPLFIDPPQRIAKRASATLDLGILANFEWWPNRDGLGWFVREVLGRLSRDVRVHLFGRGSATIAVADPRIVGHGFVDDLREVWRRCDRMLIPTRRGSGVSVKSAESLYHGMPILSTSFGLRGLPAIAHPQVVVRDSAEEWVSFLSSPQARGNERLPLDVSRHFALDANRARFDGFLARLLAPATSV